MPQMVCWSSCEKGHDLHPGTHSGLNARTCVLENKAVSWSYAQPLGGLQTDLGSRVLRADGTVLPGLYAAGEVAGFGGGGMHGYRSLEGTFLGGCLFSGRTAGRALAAAL